MSEIPEPWASALVSAGLTDPRYTDDRPSMSRLAVAIGVHTSTVSAMINGRKGTSSATVAATAEALGVDVITVAGWVGQAWSVQEPYRVPDEVNALTKREQDAISELIRAMAAARQQ